MRRLGWWGLGLVSASLALGVAATAGMLKGPDTALFRALAMAHARTADWAVSVTHVVTHLGDPSTRSFGIILFLAVLIYRRCWRSATVFLVTVAVSIAGHSVLKELFGRARPNLVPWLDHVDTYAYPSGHAAGSMVVLVLGGLLVWDRRVVAAGIVLSIAIGLSRIALGVHWPSDVIGGWMFGGGMALIGYGFAQHVQRPRVVQAT